MTEKLERLIAEIQKPRPDPDPPVVIWIEGEAVGVPAGIWEAARRLGPICNYADRCEHESGGRCRHAGYCVYQGPERRAPIGAKERK